MLSYKNIQHLGIIIATCVCFFSCQYSKTPKVFANKQVSIQYPSYLFEADDVYPSKQTLLQLKNDYRDVYFILVDYGMKPGENGFDILFDSITNQLKKNLKEPNLEAIDTTFMTSNNLKVKERQISGVLTSPQQEHRFLFIIDVFEDKNGHIYQTAGWLLRHKKQLWAKALQQSAYSLQVK